MSKVMIAGSEEAIESSIKEGKVVLNFFATWCGPCKMFKPVLEEVSEEVDGKFVKIDIDEFKDYAVEFGVNSVPTTVFLNNDEEKGRISGYQTNQDLKDSITKFLG